MGIFQAISYKTVLRECVVKPKTFYAMAEHCRVQKTYLSKVLNRDGHLNEDQLFLALDYLELNEEERHFTLLLHALERSQVQPRRKVLEAQIEALRAEKLKIEANLKLQEAQNVDLTEYYLDPNYQVIHMLLTLKRFQNNPLVVAEALGLKAKPVKKYLSALARMGLIHLHEAKGQITRAQVLRDNLHLNHDSPLHSAYAARMRLKAIERMDQIEKDEAFRFSAVFSTNAKVRQKIHASFVEWLKSTQTAVQGSAEEDVYQINFDLFKWS